MVALAVWFDYVYISDGIGKRTIFDSIFKCIPVSVLLFGGAWCFLKGDYKPLKQAFFYLIFILVVVGIGLIYDMVSSHFIKVYICTGPESECYHDKKDCCGLDSCSSSILKISKSDAKDNGYRPCTICYGDD